MIFFFIIPQIHGQSFSVDLLNLKYNWWKQDEKTILVQKTTRVKFHLFHMPFFWIHLESNFKEQIYFYSERIDYWHWHIYYNYRKPYMLCCYFMKAKKLYFTQMRIFSEKQLLKLEIYRIELKLHKNVIL